MTLNSPPLPKRVVLIIGSKSDLPIIKQSKMKEVLNTILGKNNWKLSVASAHRNAEELGAFCRDMVKGGTLAFIAAASMSAILSGFIGGAIGFSRQVIGVALPSTAFPNALDALLAQVNNPAGAPVLVASGIGKPGLYNAALSACQAVAVADPAIDGKLAAFNNENKKPAIFTFEDQDATIENSDAPKPFVGGC